MRRVGICAVAIVISFFLVLPSHAFLNSDVKKAKEFITADMYPQAVELLSKRINEKPTDADAHYLLGICQLKTNSLRRADESFARATKLDPAYKSKIAGYYRELSGANLRAKKLDAAESNYNKMIQYDPSLKNPDFLKQVGYRYLKNAAEAKGSKRGSFKRRAAGLIGQDIVDSIFQPTSLDTIWTKTFEASEADDRGRLKVIHWGVDDIKKNDEYEITIRLKPNVDIKGPVFAHVNHKRKFTAVDGLKLKRTVTKTSFSPGTFYEILLAMDVVEKVHLKVKRWSGPKIKMELINQNITR